MSIIYITIKKVYNSLSRRLEIANETNMLTTSILENVVVTVNTEGNMGAGLAREAAYRLRNTNYMERYQHFCSPEAGKDQLKTGMIQAWRVPAESKSGIMAKRILNAVTKNSPQQTSNIVWIEQILKSLRNKIKEGEIKSIALPKLGGGLGRLKWSNPGPIDAKDLGPIDAKYLGPLYAKYLGDLDIPIHVYIDAADAHYQLDEAGNVIIVEKGMPTGKVKPMQPVTITEVPLTATQSMAMTIAQEAPAHINADTDKKVRIRFPSINDQSNHLPGRNFKMICAKPAQGYENISLLAPNADDLWAHKGGQISTEEYRRRLAEKLEADMVVIEMFFLSLKGQPGNHNFGCFCRAGAIQPHKYCHREDIFGLFMMLNEKYQTGYEISLY